MKLSKSTVILATLLLSTVALCSAAKSHKGGHMRIATYNVHACSPTDRVVNYDNTAKAISLLDADVVAVQELDSCNGRCPENQIAELAARTGMHPTFARTIPYKGGAYGIGILSRREPVATFSMPLPGKEPRTMVGAEFDDYVLICTHLCYSSEDNRRKSFDLINDFVTERYGKSAKPVFLAGDFNATQLPDNAPAMWRTLSPDVVTFPSDSIRIDYILQFTGNKAPVKVLRSEVPVVDGYSFHAISDHLPVVVDFAKKKTKKKNLNK